MRFPSRRSPGAGGVNILFLRYIARASCQSAKRPNSYLTNKLIGVAAIVGWAIWAFLTYWIGTALFGGTATYGELLRTIGFAYTPNALGIFGFIPVLGGIIAFVGAVWALIAGIIAVRQALDFSTGKAIVTAIVGWIVLIIIYAILGAIGLGVSTLF